MGPSDFALLGIFEITVPFIYDSKPIKIVLYIYAEMLWISTSNRIVKASTDKYESITTITDYQKSIYSEPECVMSR